MSNTVKKKNKNLDLVKLKSGLKVVNALNIVEKELREAINELGDLSQLQDDPSLILHFCCLLENVTSVTLKGEQKQELVLKFLLDAFPSLNNERDINRLKKTINFICDMNLLTERPSNKQVAGGFISWVKKKALKSLE